LRIKTVPEDFLVEERLSVQPKARGPYALYRVEKRNITTLEAAQILSRCSKSKAFGHRVSSAERQGGCSHPTLHGENLSLPYSQGDPNHRNCRKTFGVLGSAPFPEGSCGKQVHRDRAGNFPRRGRTYTRAFFCSLGIKVSPIISICSALARGVGSLGFPGKLLLLGEWEGVLRAYLAEPLLGDPPAVLRLKKLARENWRNWPLLKEHAPKGNLRSVLTFLCDHPENFKRAVNLITPRILSLWLSAYQSFLWNRVASLVLERLLPEKTRLEYPFGELVFPRWPLPPEVLAYLKSLEIPLPSARAKTEGIVAEAFSQVLAEKGLRPEMLKARGLERAFLTKGKRPLWVVPKEPAILGEGEDELFPGHRKLVLSFALPPGSYATLFLRLLGKEFGGGENHA